jgi:hypothetical protein
MLLSSKHRPNFWTRRVCASHLTCAGVLLFAVASSGCGSDDTSASAGTGGGGATSGTGGAAGMCAASAGGPVTASTPDMHCADKTGKPIKQETNESACPLPPGASTPSADDGVADFGATLNGSEGDDDDCKYHVKWTATCIAKNTDVTVTVTITKRADGKPLVTTAAKLDLELFLSDTHIAPNLAKAAYKPSGTPGVYTLGPLRFDQSGKWTLRYHIRPDCVDLTEDSPHGHVAFYIDVP